MAYGTRIEPGEKGHLNDIDPRGLRVCWPERLTKEEGLTRATVLGAKLSHLQELVHGAGRHALVVVLQRRDVEGKDGAIRRILEAMNLRTTRAAPF